MTATTTSTRTFCRLCEVGCGLVATVEDGRLVKLRPDHDHPVTRGFACSKGLRALDVHDDPDRVGPPQQRVGDSFVDVSWTEAIGDIASSQLAFGFGRHFCLGAHLARMEIRAIFKELLGRLEHIELAGEPKWTQAYFVEGPHSAPITYGLR